MAEDYFHLNEFVGNVKYSSVPNFVDYHNSTEIVLMSANGYIASAVILFLIGVFGFLLNFTVLVIMIREKSLRTPFNTVILNLVCSDISVSIFGNPLTFTAAVYRKWIFGRTVCVLYGFFMALMGITSIMTITVLSYERYLIISKPLNSKRMNCGCSKWVICGIWTYSFTLTFPPLIGWGDYVNESANIREMNLRSEQDEPTNSSSCSVNWEHQNFGTTLYIIYLFAFGLALPVCIICFSYVKILLVLTQKRIPNGQVHKVEARVAVMLAVMVIVFLLAWTPYAVLALIVAFVDPNIVSPALSVVPALIAKSSICYNPIIYAGMNKQVRLAGYKIMGMKRPQRKASIEDDGESRWAAGKSCTEELIMDTLKIHRSNDPISGDTDIRESQMEMGSKAYHTPRVS